MNNGTTNQRGPRKENPAKEGLRAAFVVLATPVIPPAADRSSGLV